MANASRPSIGTRRVRHAAARPWSENPDVEQLKGDGWLIFSTDDCKKTYETLLGRGVELIQEPTDQPYGIDCALRDPFGNNVRICQTTE